VLKSLAFTLQERCELLTAIALRATTRGRGH
jgi:hypothetical protein